MKYVDGFKALPTRCIYSSNYTITYVGQ